MSSSTREQCDVAIIGGGPSGLAAATELKRLGVDSVVVLERECEAGGIPRHCGHSPFGLREFRRILSGPSYAGKLSTAAKSQGVDVRLNTTVVSIGESGQLELSTVDGLNYINARKVILSTGIRETTRAARLVSGQRPMGVMTTGALQSLVYLEHKKPFKNPVIIGSELVSFSALLSCRHSGIRPIAIIEQNPRITAHLGLKLLARLLGVPIYCRSRLQEIMGRRTVSGVKIETASGKTNVLECDGVVFTGKFIAESSLMRKSHLQFDQATGNPVVDQFGRCSDADYFATGNMTHPVETAGFCWSHGIETAQQVYAALAGKLDKFNRRSVIYPNNSLIKYAVPQVLAIADNGHIQVENRSDSQSIQIRVNKPVKGRLSLKSGLETLAEKSINVLPERRVELELRTLSDKRLPETLYLDIEEAD
ncbi:MAG: NAD(P)/FAD-dependent oxidoreductase [Gammaproteobacteria bacterium]|nr:NAD(P)/FAD-dependent oxidoreductase [Gammaproteobacteria bacterium]